MDVKSITGIFQNGIITKNQRWHNTNADFLYWGIHVFKRVRILLDRNTIYYKVLIAM